MSVKIIAEVAQGYEGSPHTALLLAKAAVNAKADAVKFQCVYADELAVPNYKFYDLFKDLEMTQDEWKVIVDYVQGRKTEFYFDVYGNKSLDIAANLNVDAVKIHAIDFFNSELIDQVLDKFTKVFISTGGIHEEELDEFFMQHKIPDSCELCIMYGFQAEPTPVDGNNINRLVALQKKFPQAKFGFMDHSAGNSKEATTLSLLTLSCNIAYIEKHISLDHLLELEDFISALTPTAFKNFVELIQYHEKALGSSDLSLTQDELIYRKKALKVVVANRGIQLGEIIGTESLSLKRPVEYTDSCVFKIDDVTGKKAAREYVKNDPITKDYLV
jgi:sialic acid synthase SpsE